MTMKSKMDWVIDQMSSVENEYLNASALAFAEGRDDDARRFREAGLEVRALGVRLPQLPGDLRRQPTQRRSE